MLSNALSPREAVKLFLLFALPTGKKWRIICDSVACDDVPVYLLNGAYLLNDAPLLVFFFCCLFVHESAALHLSQR